MDEKLEKDIIRLLERGDERGMKLLFQLYYKALCVYCMRYLLSYEDAEDIVQNVFVSFWEKKQGQVFVGSLQAYLYGAVTKAALKNMRDRGKRFFSEFELQIENSWEKIGQESEEQREKLRIYLWGAVDRLPTNPQKVLKEVILNNKSYKLIAEEMGVSVSTVKTHYARALRHLRKTVDPEMFRLWLLCVILPQK